MRAVRMRADGCPADGVEPVDGVLPDLGFVEGCCDASPA